MAGELTKGERKVLCQCHLDGGLGGKSSQSTETHWKPDHTCLQFLFLFHHIRAAVSGLHRDPIVSKYIYLAASSKVLLAWNQCSEGRWVEIFEDSDRFLQLDFSCIKSPQGLTKTGRMLISREQAHSCIQCMFETMLVNFSELVKSITEILPPFISKEKEYSYIFV